MGHYTTFLHAAAKYLYLRTAFPTTITQQSHITHIATRQITYDTPYPNTILIIKLFYTNKYDKYNMYLESQKSGADRKE